MRPSVYVHETPELAGKAAAENVLDDLRTSSKAKTRVVLGLPIGSSPKFFFQHLVEGIIHEKLDLSRVYVTNFDEWWPLPKNHHEAFRHQLEKAFLDKVKIPKENLLLLDSGARDVQEHLKDLQASLKQLGGVDISIHGLGEDGHFGGVNEDLLAGTGSINRVYHKAQRISTFSPFLAGRFVQEAPSGVTRSLLTGLWLPFTAKKVVLLASGSRKAAAVASAVQGKLTPTESQVREQNKTGLTSPLFRGAASVVAQRRKGNVHVYVDREAAVLLT